MYSHSNNHIQTKIGDGSYAVQPERQAQGFRLFEQRFSPYVFECLLSVFGRHALYQP